MRIFNDITAQVITDNEKNQKLFILLNNKPLNIIVDGCFLNAVVEVDINKFILFVTSDCPFEETLSVYLIDTMNALVLDSLWMGLMYETDIFLGVKIENDNIIFKFISNKLWCLTYLKHGFFSISYFLEELRNPIVHRKLSIKYHLKIKHI